MINLLQEKVAPDGAKVSSVVRAWKWGARWSFFCPEQSMAKVETAAAAPTGAHPQVPGSHARRRLPSRYVIYALGREHRTVVNIEHEVTRRAADFVEVYTF